MTASRPPSGAAGPTALSARALQARRDGRLAEAAQLFTRVLAEAPPEPQSLLMAGETFYRIGLLRAAEEAVTAGQALAPGQAAAEFLLGRILLARGRLDEARDALVRAIRLRPEDALAWRLLAALLASVKRDGEARDAFAEADRLQPGQAAAYNELGISLLGERRPREAEALFRQALALAPDLVAALQNLGAALAAQERLDEAMDAEREALARQPSSVSALVNFGAFANSRGRFRASRHALLRAYAAAPAAPDVLNNLAQLRLEEGDTAAAAALLDEAVRKAPAHRAAGHNRLLARNYIVDTAPADWLAAARQVAAPYSSSVPLALGRREAQGQRLRVGMISPDFRRHSCASFLGPLFAHRDRQAFELVAYSDNPADDEITTTLRAAVDVWRPVSHLNDVTVAEAIADDRIDILVDLCGHMAGNRLPVFALQPAPVQVSWLGYPDTTGVDAIKFRLTDAISDPPGMTVALHSETLWRLPRCFLAFGPDGAAPPAGRNTDGDGVVFGSFNHLPKVTPAVVAAWSRILAAVPGSRLLMKAKRLGEPETRERYLKLFSEHGIAEAHLDLIGWQDAPQDHLALYQRIDIALDPFPYNGTTTTCEALWMGVPVVTLAGTRHAGRVGASLLNAVGLESCVARTIDEYVALAAGLATGAAPDVPRGEDLRRQMAQSALCDGRAFAAAFAEALRGMWSVSGRSR
jgi:protein O-GlcNAc transferase